MTNSERTPVVIFGAGGLAREVAWAASLTGAILRFPEGVETAVQVIGHLDDRKDARGTIVNGLPVLGGAEWLSQHPGHAVLVAVGNPSVRQEIVSRLINHGAKFPSMLSPGSLLGSHSDFGQGLIALPGVVITANVNIGEFVLLNPHVSISHDCKIGSYCSFGPGVSLAGNVSVGAGSDIGTNASVIPGKSVGNNCVIGAGACVVNNIPSGSTAVGVPARVVK